VAVEGNDVREVVVRGAGAVGERPSGVDQRRVDLERAEQQVDRLSAAGLERPRIGIVGRPGISLAVTARRVSSSCAPEKAPGFGRGGSFRY